MGKKLAITIGDPAGVGAEIIRTWAEKNPGIISRAEVIAHASFLDTLPDSIGKRKVGDSGYKARAGFPDSSGAVVAFEALEAAAAGCVEGRYFAVTTAPVSKAEMKKVGFNFAGQTEFFADRWGGNPVMAFAGEHFLLSLVTWHEPLRVVPDSITAEKIARAVESARIIASRAKGIQYPRIAVCALNPHAGENGILGLEEIESINPVLDALRADERYRNLSSALPPDTVFERAIKGEFDSIVSMYHDQGLAPLKAIDFDNAVNISMNLPFVRTSPDHGTGFGIAGRGIASANSFECAVNLAFKLGDSSSE